MQGRHEHLVQQPMQDSSAQDQVLPSDLCSHPLSVLGLAYGMLMLFSISEPTHLDQRPLPAPLPCVSRGVHHCSQCTAHSHKGPRCS